jgi:outer membrane protein assembly factor BamB/tRNA A-37 threonylcarbamoyl transferase component Bud32
MVDTRQFANDGDKKGFDGALRPNAILQNRYRIEGVLGVGGMGSVYKARDMQFPDVKRYVAVKEMLQQTTDPEVRENALRNFQREANILAGLNHPAIPTIHDYFSTKERAYLVMEFINGHDLDHILMQEEGFLPTERVVEWCIELCEVLHYLHTSEPPIIFRDVKPSNIMVDVHERLRLIDFGIAKHFNPEKGKGTMIGTEGYAAPESYRGLATPSSDVFGVGATLHHLLTKHDPRMQAPFTFMERPIRAVNPEVPAELENIVMRAVAFNDPDRFPTAKEMAQALRGLLNRGGSRLVVSAAPSGVTEAWDAVSSDSLGIEPRWKFKVEEEIRSTPCVAGKLVFVTAYDNNLYAVDIETGQLKWKYAADDVVASSPAIYEDEFLVIFGSKDRNLYAVDYRTGRIKWTFQTQGPIYSSPAVRHGHVFFGCDDGHVYALRAPNGRQAWKAVANETVRCRPAVTEERVLFGTGASELMAYDLSGQIKWRFKARKPLLSSPCVHKGLIYVGSMDGHIYAIGLDTGWAAWKVQTNKPVVSSPVVGGDRLYVGSVNGILYALDLNSGREKWKFETGDQITSSPAYADEGVYFGANNNKFYALDAKTGKERWSYETQGQIPGSPFVHEGLVYIGSTDHHLYAFKA